METGVKVEIEMLGGTIILGEIIKNEINAGDFRIVKNAEMKTRFEDEFTPYETIMINIKNIVMIANI